MKRIFLVIIAAALLLCSCGGYNEPDVGALMDELCFIQGLEDMTEADGSGVDVLFDISLDDVESYSVRYSSQGGYADMIAIFRMKTKDGAAAAEKALLDYKAARYEDFKGYAPFEAKKVEDGQVLAYDKYVLLLIVSNIDTAVSCADTEFTE